MSKEIYKRAIRLWGEELQFDIAIEECSELIKAIIKYKRTGSTDDTFLRLCDEIADVSIMLEQLQEIVKFQDCDCATFVRNVKKRKMARLEERIKEGGEE